MNLIKHKIFPTMFIMGHIRDDNAPPDTFKQVGTVIVKGTFLNMANPTIAPADEQVPIFVKDQPYNLVKNSGFEEDDFEPWYVHNGNATLEENWGAGNHPELKTALKLNSIGPESCIKQTLSFGESLGGRTFVLSFYAQAKTEVNIDGFSLQITGTDHRICEISATIPQIPVQLPPPSLPELNYQRFVSQPETWPVDESATEMEVILPGSGQSGNEVYFDRVQVEETTKATRWDENSIFRYEHDLAPFKPFADIIVLGLFTLPPSPTPPPPPAPQFGWEILIELNLNKVVRKRFAVNTDPLIVRSLFGWAARSEGTRKEQSGNLELFKHKEQVLPTDFNNNFYNGMDRDVQGDIPVDYLVNSSNIIVHTNPPGLFNFEILLPSTRPVAVLCTQNAQGRENTIPLNLNLDTLIIEPEINRYMVIWRGCWILDEQFPKDYSELHVSGGI